MEKLKNFYLKYKMALVLSLSTTLLFLSGFFDPLWIVAAALVIVCYTSFNFGEIFASICYFSVLSNFGLFYIVILLGAFAVIAVKYIVDVCLKKRKFFAVPFVLTTLFVAVFSCFHYNYNTIGLENGVLVLALLYVIYFVFVYKDQVDVHECFRFIVMAIVISGAFGSITLLFDGYAYSIFHNDGMYKRLQLFCFQQNHLAMICTFVIAYYIYKFLNKQLRHRIAVPVIVVCVIAGILTLSKAFIVMCVGFVGYLFIYYVVKYRRRSFKIILCVVAGLALMSLLFRGFVKDVFERFLAYNTTNSFINRITTGRSKIWYEYIEAITSSIPKMLFGHGIFNAELISIGAHNVLLFFAYRTGLIGLIILGLIAFSYAKASETKCEFKYKKLLPLLTFIILSFNEMIFSDRFFMYLILAILLLLPKKQTSVKETENKDNE